MMHIHNLNSGTDAYNPAEKAASSSFSVEGGKLHESDAHKSPRDLDSEVLSNGIQDELDLLLSWLGLHCDLTAAVCTTACIQAAK